MVWNGKKRAGFRRISGSFAEKAAGERRNCGSCGMRNANAD
jgi:hypothetical protein